MIASDSAMMASPGECRGRSAGDRSRPLTSSVADGPGGSGEGVASAVLASWIRGVTIRPRDRKVRELPMTTVVNIETFAEARSDRRTTSTRSPGR